MKYLFLVFVSPLLISPAYAATPECDATTAEAIRSSVVSSRILNARLNKYYEDCTPYWESVQKAKTNNEQLKKDLAVESTKLTKIRQQIESIIEQRFNPKIRGSYYIYDRGNYESKLKKDKFYKKTTADYKSLVKRYKKLGGEQELPVLPEIGVKQT